VRGVLAYFIATPVACALALRKPILSIQELSPRTMESCTVRECAPPISTASHRPPSSARLPETPLRTKRS